MTRRSLGLTAFFALAIVPCLFASDRDAQQRVDLSIGGLTLLDPASAVRWLGGDIPFESGPCPTAIYGTKDGRQMLTMTFHDGDVKNSVSEARIQILDQPCRDCQRLENVTTFVSGRGVRLGLTEREVERILGKPSRRVMNGQEVRLEYRVDDASGASFLKRHNLPSYYVRCVFRKNALVDYAFGFPYP